MDNNNSNQDQLWQPCPEGMLRQVARRCAENKHTQKGHGGQNQFDRRRLLQIAAAVAVTGGAGTIAYNSLFAPDMRGAYGGITCKTFLSNMRKYIDKGLEDQKLEAKMDNHLKLCKMCQVRYDRMKNA